MHFYNQFVTKQKEFVKKTWLLAHCSLPGWLWLACHGHFPKTEIAIGTTASRNIAIKMYYNAYYFPEIDSSSLTSKDQYQTWN